MDILNNLEVTRLKVESQARIDIAKQRMMQEGIGARGETAQEWNRLRMEVERDREEAENKVEEARERWEEDFKATLKSLKSDYDTKLDRDSTRIQRAYNLKAQEECLSLRQKQEEALERIQTTKRELRDKFLFKRLNTEKARAEQEIQERVRDLKIQASKDLEMSKAALQAEIYAKHINNKSQMKIEHYSLIKEIQLNMKDKYQHLKDQDL